ncbi:MAG: hypothetical protein U0Q16_29145 [Bryobacteraceae bacterium]
MILPALLAFIVNGTVINQTTGKPTVATVTLYKLGGAGPEAIESVKSGADGKFSINQTPAAGPHLVQAAFDGVLYNHMLFPGRPTTDLNLAVYNASKARGSAKLSTHMLLLESNGSELSVSESYVWQNDGNTAFYDPAAGAFRFSIPEGAGKVRVMCTHPTRMGVPIERAAEKVGGGLYKVDFPVKPGETRFDLDYKMPGGTFAAKNPYPEAPVNIVAPVGIMITGDGVKNVGTHPETQASIYRVEKPDFKFEIKGEGSLRAPEEESGGDEGEGLKQIRPRVYDRFYPILALTAVILVSGLLLLARKQTPEPVAAGEAVKSKRKS